MRNGFLKLSTDINKAKQAQEEVQTIEQVGFGGAAPKGPLSAKMEVVPPNSAQALYFAAQAEYAKEYAQLHKQVSAASEEFKSISDRYANSHPKDNENDRAPLLGGPHKGIKKAALIKMSDSIGEGATNDAPGLLKIVTHSNAYNARTFEEMKSKWENFLSFDDPKYLANLKLGSGKKVGDEKVSETYHEVYTCHQNYSGEVTKAITATANAKAKLDMMDALVLKCNKLEAAEANLKEASTALEARDTVENLMKVIYDDQGASKFPQFTQGKKEDIEGTEGRIAHLKQFQLYLHEQQGVLKKAGDALDQTKMALLTLISKMNPDQIKQFQSDIDKWTKKLQRMDALADGPDREAEKNEPPMVLDAVKEECLNIPKNIALLSTQVAMMDALVLKCNKLEAAEANLKETSTALGARDTVENLMKVIYDDQGASKFPQFTQGKKDDIEGTEGRIAHLQQFQLYLDKQQGVLKKAGDALDQTKMALLTLISNQNTADLSTQFGMMDALVLKCNKLEAAEANLKEASTALEAGDTVENLMKVIYDDQGASKFPQFTQGKKDDIEGTDEGRTAHLQQFQLYLEKQKGVLGVLKEAADALDQTKMALLTLISKIKPGQIEQFQSDIVKLTEKLQRMDALADRPDKEAKNGEAPITLTEVKKECLAIQDRIAVLSRQVSIQADVGARHENPNTRPQYRADPKLH